MRGAQFRLRTLVLAVAVIGLALALGIQTMRLQQLRVRTERALTAERRARACLRSHFEQTTAARRSMMR